MSSPKSKWIFTLVVAVAAAAVAICMLVDGCTRQPEVFEQRPTELTSTTALTTAPTALTTTTPLPENPVDFAYWQGRNSDIYAWLEVPGTVINYPVLCASDQSDAFYLDHNVDRQYSAPGSIYSEKKNGRTLSDRHTVIYGHNQADHSMFGELYYFERESFFNEHKEFYIYTPGHILTYTVFAAYEYDDRHLLNSFDYSDDAVWAAYLENAQNPKSFKVMTRDMDLQLTDRIVTLSTCTDFNPNARYLVQGVLTNDQPTQ